MFIELTPTVSVAGQIVAADVAVAASQGFRVVVNNRPDGEASGQPSGAEIAAAASAAGLDYVAIPVDHRGIGPAQVEAMAAALATGKLLAFCRSGTRSTHLWALAEASRGGDPEAIVATAAAAHFDVSALLPTVRR